MATITQATQAEFIQFEAQDAGALMVARKRITPIVRAWASAPGISNLDLYWLAVSCYLQGAVDGYDVAERNHLREQGK